MVKQICSEIIKAIIYIFIDVVDFEFPYMDKNTIIII